MTLGKNKTQRIRVLCDSGASGTILNRKFAEKLRIRKDKSSTWATAAGSFNTTERTKINFALPELSSSLLIRTDVFLCKDLSERYDLIMGRDLLRELKLKMDFEHDVIEYHDLKIPMRSPNRPGNDEQELLYSTGIVEPEAAVEAVSRVKNILAAKYAPVSPEQILKASEHLTAEQKREILPILQKHKSLFDGTLGKWKDVKHRIELKDPSAPPISCRPYGVPRANRETLMVELERLCELGVLRRINRSEWQAPSMIIPKKDGTVRFITDFRQLNTRIKRKAFPLPNIKDTLLELEGFKYGTTLDLNMGYYHIEVHPESKHLCTLVFPFGKYEYQRLPMGLCNSPDIFQEHMSELMQGLEYVRAYIDDVAIFGNASWEEHLTQVDTVLQRLRDAGLKVNGLKSFFGMKEVEYLGYILTQNGVKPQPKKVEGLLNIAPPKTVRQLRSFLGAVNYYRDMWMRRSHILAPLNRLLKKGTKWKWSAEEDRAFENIKRVMAKETLLHYADFNQPFEIHTDASLRQIGAVISQNGKPIAFYTRKLRDGQHNYTTTERELLAIVETLKEFRTILLGQQLKIYTDHKNLTFNNFNVERVMRWRMVLEEYDPELIYIKGTSNIVADALSRLDLLPDDVSSPVKKGSDASATEPRTDGPNDVTVQDLLAFNLDELPPDAYPLRYSLIMREQQKDAALQNKLNHKGFSSKEVRGGQKRYNIIYYNDKIVVPKTLQKRVVNWYHEILCHPGINRTEQTIRQHLTWPKLEDDFARVCKTCDTCQRTKKTKLKYGKLPAKEAEGNPWDTLCIDLIGPYTIDRHNKKNLTLHCLTMIDPATGWFEIVRLPAKRADVIANLLEQTWLTRYPWPVKVICDRGTEFMAEVRTMLKEDYGIKVSNITTRNPQANAILERIHQTIGNMLRTFQLQDTDEENPFDGTLAAVAFATRATIHTTLGTTPSQLVFGRDAILNTNFEVDWALIQARKQRLINENNRRENKKRRPHEYKVGDKVLIKNDPSRKYGTDAYSGPVVILQVNDNGTIRYRKRRIIDVINIRNITPYTE